MSDLSERRRLVLVKIDELTCWGMRDGWSAVIEQIEAARAAGLLDAEKPEQTCGDCNFQCLTGFCSVKKRMVPSARAACDEFEPRPEQETRPDVPTPAKPERSEARPSERFRDRMAERAERIKRVKNQAEVRAVAEELLALIDELEQRVSELEGGHETE